MKLIEVNSERDAGRFLEVPVLLYKADSNWVRPLDKDIREVFDKKKNKAYRQGDAKRWILEDEKGRLIGRVAAFFNQKSFTGNVKVGGMGFFECIHDEKSAFMLFDVCRDWLSSQGIQGMDGPVNFGERDKWWGLLIDGFSPPTYRTNYNKKYYRDFFEAYGFRVYFEQYNYVLSVDHHVPEKFRQRSDKIAADPKYSCRHFLKSEIAKFTEDFRTIYNKGWAKHPGFKQMPESQARSIISSLKPIMEEELIWFAYYEDEPIAFFIMLPEINEIIRHLNGKLDWFGKLKFLWHKWTGTCKRIFGVAFGIVPEHQSRGVEGYIIWSSAKVVQPMKKYEELELTWIGDFNPKMINMVESLGSRKFRTYYTYRKFFDESIPFTRAPVLD